MTPDLVAELLRQLLREAMMLTAPILLIAMVLGLLLTLVQTLTNVQEQSLTTVPRLFAVGVVVLAGMPWFVGRLVAYALLLMSDLRRYLG